MNRRGVNGVLIGLVANACMSFTGLYFISKVINYRTDYVRLQQLLVGVLSGGLGIFLMTQGVLFEDVVIIDFRYLALILLGFYRLVSPLFITATLISIYRFSFGLTPQAGVASVAIFLIACGIVMLYHVSLFEKKHFLFGVTLNVWACLIVSLTILINGGFTSSAFDAALLVVSVSFLIGLLMTVLNVDVFLISQRVKAYKRSAETDHLTGLANRRAWEVQLRTCQERYSTCNVLILDIDHFKRINDRYGHSNGDEILKQFAKLLQQETRDQDVKARIGGEEFALLIPLLSHQEVMHVAERIRERVANHEFQLLNYRTIQLSVSIGIANGNSENVHQMIHLADDSLYQAKHNGRNQTFIHETIV